MRVIVTRPAVEGRAWVEFLAASGMAAIALPLIDIGPAPDPQVLDAARMSLAEQQAVMFVSGNAVRGFFTALPAAFVTRAWAPGPGTFDALRAAGVPAPSIDMPATRFDSEGLWEVVRPQARPGARLLVVRGADASGAIAGRDWLVGQAEAAGMQVQQVAAYQRARPVWSGAELAQAQRAAGPDAVWIFSSSEAAANLRALAPGQDWRAAQALATHPRIAEAVRDLGFGQVHATQPQREAVLASLQSLR